MKTKLLAFDGPPDWSTASNLRGLDTDQVTINDTGTLKGGTVLEVSCT